eukprot:CAMPEP_0196153144 /NCGR_PEP_ID=MMETSP0910-20130528/36667_1 /TAXON_ID=49265 /ORGANISM="Thalassiosira rotula, Strain GSO102" /LENGTH=70 /DNA_ID=CAMNT_0041416889 /DNA_START=277 /DNA_END=489 /DNA_ORIENTATION=+
MKELYYAQQETSKKEQHLYTSTMRATHGESKKLTTPDGSLSDDFGQLWDKVIIGAPDDYGDSNGSTTGSL